MSREAMKLALVALRHFEKAGLATLKTIDAIAAIKQALEQPEPEPVAWTLLLVGEQHGIIGKAGETFESHPNYYKRVDVYTSPPKREPLTDEEIADLWRAQIFHIVDLKLAKDFVRDIEAAHGIKGEDHGTR